MSPIIISSYLSQFHLTYLFVGIAFGISLEVAGFGDARNLAAQFYFKDMRVFKVMFTAIITAMILIFFFSSQQLLDFEKIWVNPTFMWSQIVGGLVMGLGFILGGYCPGTSAVSLATLRIDGLMFVVGVMAGTLVFGESVTYFPQFFHSGDLGRFTLFDLAGVNPGWFALGFLIFVLILFPLVEKLERINGTTYFTSRRTKFALVTFSILGVILAFTAGVVGQPNADKRVLWSTYQAKEQLENRSIYIHPGELRDLMVMPDVYLTMIDIRSEEDFNLFHIKGAVRYNCDEVLKDEKLAKKLNAQATNTVTVLMSNDEECASKGFKILNAMNVLNLYILDGGINNWLEVFHVPEEIAVHKQSREPEQLAYSFKKAVGSDSNTSYPFSHHEHQPEIKYVKKVVLKKKAFVKGGCG